MLRGFGKLILLIRAGFKICRVVLAEEPSAECGLSEWLLGCESVVDESVCSDKGSHQTARAIRGVEITERYAFLSAGSRPERALTCADDAVIL